MDRKGISQPSFHGEEGNNLNFFLDQINNLTLIESWSDARKLKYHGGFCS